MQKSKRKAIGGLIFGIGLIALLIGAMTDLYDTETGVLVMLGVWFIGGALAALAIGGNEETPKPPEQS